MVKFQYPRKTLLTLPPVGVAAPLTCPVSMLGSSRIPAIHPSLLGRYQEETVGVLGEAWQSLPCWAESPVKRCFLNGSTVVSAYDGDVPGPNSIKWHSCIVLIPATVIGESPETHLSPLHFLTVLITVSKPALLLGSTLTSTIISPTCPNQSRTESILRLAYPCLCSELLTQYPKFQVALLDLVTLSKPTNPMTKPSQGRIITQ